MGRSNFREYSTEELREISRKGGIASRDNGKAYRWTAESARLAALKSAEVRRAKRDARKAAHENEMSETVVHASTLGETET